MADLKIETYEELEDFVNMFKGKYTDLLTIKGAPGTGKSYAVKKVMNDEDYLFINTHITPFRAYKLMYDYKDCSVVIDDIDNLIQNSKLVALLKQTGETNEIKHLEWNTTADLDGYPSEFDTKSNILLISNKLNIGGNVNRQALFDRGFILNFQPKKDEVLRKMRDITRKTKDLEKKWEVYNFIKENFDFAKEVNLRTLVKGFQLAKWDGQNWKKTLKEQMGHSKRLERVYNLLQKHDTVTDAIEEYDKSKTTFHKWKRKLKKRGVI